MTYQQSKDIAQKFAQVAPQGYTYVVKHESWKLAFTRPDRRDIPVLRVYADGHIEEAT